MTEAMSLEPEVHPEAQALGFAGCDNGVAGHGGRRARRDLEDRAPSWLDAGFPDEKEQSVPRC